MKNISNFAKLSENEERILNLCEIHIMNYYELYSVVEWLQNCCIKKTKKGITPQFEHLKNCATVKRLAGLSLKSVKKYEYEINISRLTPAMSERIRGYIAQTIEDGTLFYLRDWQGAHPETAEEIEEFDWIREDGKSAVVLHGLPRVIF